MALQRLPLVNERAGTVREVGNNAIWSLSSCKPGNCSMCSCYYNVKIDIIVISDY